MMPAQRQPHGLQPSLWDARAGAKVRAARAAAYPSTDEGQWEGVSEPPTARCTPAFTPQSSSSPPRAAGLTPEPSHQLCPAERLLAAHTHHVGGQLVPRQVLDILVLRVDDVREPPAAHLLFQHPHVHLALKAAQPSCIDADDLGDGRTPAEGTGRPWQWAPGSPGLHRSRCDLRAWGWLAPATGGAEGGQGRTGTALCSPRGPGCPRSPVARAHDANLLATHGAGSGALWAWNPSLLFQGCPEQGRPRPAPGPASPRGHRAPAPGTAGGQCAAGAKRCPGAPQIPQNQEPQTHRIMEYPELDGTHKD